jgi:hypothetical protein
MASEKIYLKRGIHCCPHFLFLLPIQRPDIVKNICILAGVPGVARDENLRKQIFEIAWRDEGWIG